VIPGREKMPLKQVHYRIPETELSTFLALVQASVALLLKADNLSILKELDKLAAQLATTLSLAIETIEKPDQEAGSAAPWWTEECQEAYYKHLDNRTSQGFAPETQHFLSTVQRAKQKYWKHVINSVKDNKDLYKVIK
jgi:hypothetical protein